MEEKENSEFSSSVLLAAVAIYVAITSALFAGMMVVKPTAAAAFAAWARDYGAIIAGIPVLIAVWVAKQQLEANRRQHAVQLYEAKRGELDALEGLVAYFDQLLRERDGAFATGRDLTEPDLNLTYRVSMHTQFSVSSYFSRLQDQVDDYNKTDRKAVTMFGGEESAETTHGALCCEIFGGIEVFRKSALERIAQIQSLAPSTHVRPLPRSL